MDIETPTQQLDLDGLRASITKQASLIRGLKQGMSDESLDLGTAIEKLKKLKLELENRTAKSKGMKEKNARNQKALDDLLLRKMFVVPAFEIYGGVGGFYDFGPPGSAVKSNLLKLWREYFVQADSMLEIECTNIVPEIVLKTSGHVEKFTDLMVKDESTGECYRADKLIEEHIDILLDKAKGQEMSQDERLKHQRVSNTAESMSIDEIHDVIQSYAITSPGTGNPLTKPRPFNLMFSCAIGPESSQVGYLRPETAQGIFVNFRRLLEYNAGKLPFAVAQIGNAFRNEISPRGGLLRVREFQQAEIEHFVHPRDKKHANFSAVKDLQLVLFPKDRQLSDGKTIVLSVKTAVSQKMIDNETLAYYMARTAQFVKRVGIKNDGVRFRQHLDTEMAHYACDCWDLEILINGSWIECAGHADRSCFDLQAHSKKSRVEMVGTQKFSAPQQVEMVEMKLNKGLIGRFFKKEAKAVTNALEELKNNSSKANDFEELLKSNGSAELKDCSGSYKIERDMVHFQLVTKTINEVKFIPSVIEPSFGIGRILSAVFEHCYYSRPDDEKRGVMKFPAALAPIKVSVSPLSSNSSFFPFVGEIEKILTENGVSIKTDNSGVAIGRKYARADELGIPFNLTIDFETPITRSVTLRERDSCDQIRVPISKLLSILGGLISEKMSWNAAKLRFPIVRGDTAACGKTRIESTSRGNFRRPV